MNNAEWAANWWREYDAALSKEWETAQPHDNNFLLIDALFLGKLVRRLGQASTDKGDDNVIALIEVAKHAKPSHKPA